MKRYGNLFKDVCSLENLARAHENARRGKRHYREVKMVDADPEAYLRQIQEKLMDGFFQTSTYTAINKNEYGKPRAIHKLPYFPDRIVHHAIVQVIIPVWDKTLIRDTYACIRGRGIHDGARRIKKALRDVFGTRYCLKMDVKKFYPSMDHEVLKCIIQKKIKDPDLLALIFEIIDSFRPGVPIGNYLSQFFGNLYLSGYDHWMKEINKCRYYFRYCDDVVVLGADKQWLHELKAMTDAYWSGRLKLKLKKNWQVFPVDARGIDFLGYRFFHGYTLLRKSIARKFQKKMDFIKRHHRQMAPVSVMSSVMSYEGWMRHANCLNLKKAYFDDRLRAAVANAATTGGTADPLSKCVF
ncbi:MAG: RNA-directed DNA polymerase [Desulfobacterales bacterium]|nr:RNA-directed DNA polymerase [Desulfobacterales bacterium]